MWKFWGSFAKTLSLCVKYKRFLLDVRFYNFFPMTWMQHDHLLNFPSAPADPLLPQFKNQEKNHHHFVFITNVTQDFALVFFSFPRLLRGKKKHSDFLISFFCRSFCFSFTLKESYGTARGLLDARHSRLSLGRRTVWNSPSVVTVCWSGLVGYFILSVKLHLTSLMLHTFWLILNFIHEFKNVCILVKKKGVYIHVCETLLITFFLEWKRRRVVFQEKNNCINSHRDLGAVCERLISFLFFGIFFLSYFGNICQ